MQQFLLYSHCVFASWLLLPCNKLKQYLGALLLLFFIHCYLQESRDAFPHTELFLQLLLLENSPSCNSCLSHVLNPYYFTNVIGMSHSLTVLLLNLGWVFSGFQPMAASSGKSKWPRSWYTGFPVVGSLFPWSYRMNFSLAWGLVVIKVVLAEECFRCEKKRVLTSCKVMRLKWEVFICAFFLNLTLTFLGYIFSVLEHITYIRSWPARHIVQGRMPVLLLKSLGPADLGISVIKI